MQIQKNKSLQSLNTFGIEAKAESFVEVHSVKELQGVLKENNASIFVLGGGSNLLLTKDIKGLVIHNNIKGRKIEREFKHVAYVSAGGGENWHQFVLWTIEKGLGGIENLSLIPGRVGASPIQNIGAYGVELKDVFHRLEAVELATGELRVFRKKDCAFGYRESIFKKKYKGKFCITKVVLKLSKRPKINLTYGAIAQTLALQNIKNPTIKEVSNAVIQIRSSKLPDPAELGNSGSFFKNPEISKRQFRSLQKAFPHIVFYPLKNEKIKIPAGWLIEQCGWKGKRIGNTGCHAQQALVLVNYGNATGKEIQTLALKIMDSVKTKFGIELKMEVNVV
ncbi:MAG TPA: UDP-N-acetylmuramate dehydrogenase [Phaeodactylibacter sp.]|nr:UDP-N-acetylmuramate dehydrogenase [Phaeodactylibacter sp.]